MQNISFIEAAGDAADGAVFPASLYEYPTRKPRSEWKPGYREHVEEIERKYGKNVGPKTGAQSPKGTTIAADCIFAYEQAVKAAGGTEDPDKIVSAIEALDVPADKTPSGNAIKPGDSHEFYQQVHLYQWHKDDKGWYTTELNAS
jgi:branched-chain amino acid transport system substrate-binding protein